MNVNGIKREAGEKLVLSGKNRIWFCDGCGEPFLWDDDSSYFGSYANMDAGRLDRLWFACSPQCKTKMPADFPKGVRQPRRSLVKFVKGGNDG